VREQGQIVFRHLSGGRATQIDVVPAAAHRELILGRAESAAIRFVAGEDREVGQFHACIRLARGRSPLEVHDLGSRNGTFLNGDRVRVPTPLRSGDVIQLGPGGPAVEVTFSEGPGARPEFRQPG
jgi:serine protease Do